jgi:hypothetical protein
VGVYSGVRRSKFRRVGVGIPDGARLHSGRKMCQVFRRRARVVLFLQRASPFVKEDEIRRLMLWRACWSKYSLALIGSIGFFICLLDIPSLDVLLDLTVVILWFIVRSTQYFITFRCSSLLPIYIISAKTGTKRTKTSPISDTDLKNGGFFSILHRLKSNSTITSTRAYSKRFNKNFKFDGKRCKPITYYSQEVIRFCWIQIAVSNEK